MDKPFGAICKKLRRKGYTLGEIMKATKRPKGSVYFHIQSIPISKRLKKRIQTIKGKNIQGKGLKRGISRLKRSIRSFHIWEPWSVRLVSHIIFDGSITRKGVIYHNRNLQAVDQFSKDMSRVCLFSPRRYTTKENVHRVAFYNIEMESFWKKKTALLIGEVALLRKNLQREFLKAFFHDEGSVYFNNISRVRRITGVQYNQNILNLVEHILATFNISAQRDKHI